MFLHVLKLETLLFTVYRMFYQITSIYCRLEDRVDTVVGWVKRVMVDAVRVRHN